MSFFGKKYKKVDIENVFDVLDAINVGEKSRALMRQPDAITSFEKNADGTIQYTSTANGNVLLNQKIELGKETNFNTPDSEDIKVIFTLEGNVLKSIMKLADGKVVHMDREFEGNKMKMTMGLEGKDAKGIVYYEAV